MAGDWIKMRTRLAEERAVMLICDMTGLDPFAVVGRLHAIWSWAGEHTVTGTVTHVTLKTVDRVTCCEGFAKSMLAANWLEEMPGGGLIFPRWKKHNSKSAKQRALASERQARKRARKRDADRDGKRDASVTSHAPREEKRREEKNHSTTLNDTTIAPNSFDRFWEAFPSGRKQGKAAARKAFDVACRKVDAATIIAAAVEYAASPVGQGEYVKGPTPWLNQECWQDDRAAWNRSQNGKSQKNTTIDDSLIPEDDQ